MTLSFPRHPSHRVSPFWLGSPRPGGALAFDVSRAEGEGGSSLHAEPERAGRPMGRLHEYQQGLDTDTGLGDPGEGPWCSGLRSGSEDHQVAL